MSLGDDIRGREQALDAPHQHTARSTPHLTHTLTVRLAAWTDTHRLTASSIWHSNPLSNTDSEMHIVHPSLSVARYLSHAVLNT